MMLWLLQTRGNPPIACKGRIWTELENNFSTQTQQSDAAKKQMNSLQHGPHQLLSFKSKITAMITFSKYLIQPLQKKHEQTHKQRNDIYI